VLALATNDAAGVAVGSCVSTVTRIASMMSVTPGQLPHAHRPRGEKVSNR
jgi:hypothetical protein